MCLFLNCLHEVTGNKPEPVGAVCGWQARWTESAVNNFEVPGTVAQLDTAVHEGVHAFVEKRLPLVWDLGAARPFRIPVGAPVAYAEEIVAYSAGRLAPADYMHFHLCPLTHSVALILAKGFS